MTTAHCCGERTPSALSACCLPDGHRGDHTAPLEGGAVLKWGDTVTRTYDGTTYTVPGVCEWDDRGQRCSEPSAEWWPNRDGTAMVLCESHAPRWFHDAGIPIGRHPIGSSVSLVGRSRRDET